MRAMLTYGENDGMEYWSNGVIKRLFSGNPDNAGNDLPAPLFNVLITDNSQNADEKPVWR
jgi:hypothetical protein